ncbi:hypothetical protein CLH39_11850 [Alcaligenes faecalis]|uniref:hypothetical protein n=1 Tax=Alcaligenes faecalis TaxID=511 RepID=UPI001933F891|nr:hypothetical protein [Alcaligenes faecalis]QRF90882.1 hypothetical protein CLH39_11850 [Alcaligenes faecalis]
MSEVWKEYQLKLFFSADIVGSTAFKQKPNNASKAWFDAVLAFYHQAELEFLRKWKDFKSKIDESGEPGHPWFGDEPVVWKTVGDEILFVKNISHPMQAFLSLKAWIATLEEIRKNLQRKHGLDVKSSAWLAEFPLKNREIVLGEARPNGEDDFDLLNERALQAFYKNGLGGTNKNLVRDFIGPSIDTGFRLGGFTSPRKLVLSVELAHVLACEQSYAEVNDKWHSIGPSNISRFIFRYEGRHALKGVLGGSPYPIFWLDLDPENRMHRAEDDLLDTRRPSASKVQEFTTAILEEYSRYLSFPMFCNSQKVSSDNSNGFADCHTIVSHEIEEAIASYKQDIVDREEKRRNELTDIGESKDEPQTEDNKELVESIHKKLRARDRHPPSPLRYGFFDN